MAFQAPKMAPKMAPQTPRMALIAPIIALPQTDKPNFEGAAVIPEGIVNSSGSSSGSSSSGGSGGGVVQEK